MDPAALDILYEDNHCLAVAKPSGVVSTHFQGREETLDRAVKAAARLAEQFREGTVEKIYWAIVEGKLEKNAGTLEDWLQKNPDTRRVDVVEPRTAGARQALLHFQRRGGHGDLTWLEVRPQT